MRWSIAGLALGLAALGTTAGAQTPEILDGITGPKLIEILQGEGYRATLGVDDEKKPLVSSATGGVNFDIFFYQCDEAKLKTCTQLQFAASFTPSTPITAESMNEYNAGWVFAGAHVNTDGTVVVEHAIDVGGGVTQANLLNNMTLWESILDTFKTHINW